MKKYRSLPIGQEDFSRIIDKNVFYIDKTNFIKEWWEDQSIVTLITRPRRFGKTLTMNMVEHFFSIKYANEAQVFQDLDISKDKDMMALQGTYPVIFVSFATVKQKSYNNFITAIKKLFSDLYEKFSYIMQSDYFDKSEKKLYESIRDRTADEVLYQSAIYDLSKYLYRYYGKRVIILCDEYDTPMIEAYTHGYWREAVEFFQVTFHAALKGNEYLERGLLTGITKVTHESLFSDLNNLSVVTTMTERYETSFGFTEEEVFHALDEYELSAQKENVKLWYDGFIFGKKKDIYNPWSIISYLKWKKFEPYWVNTGGTTIIDHLIKNSATDVKEDFEKLLNQESITVIFDESITYEQLNGNANAIFSWLATAGYLKIEKELSNMGMGFFEVKRYEMKLTNLEVRVAIRTLIARWFTTSMEDYTNFVYHLVKTGNLSETQKSAEKVTKCVFSFYDVGKGKDIIEEIERFYHGFILGLLAGVGDDYIVTSNRESGFGRYDVCIEPRNRKEDAVILEFKVFEEADKTLENTARGARKQIEDRAYETDFIKKGFTKVRKYGFGFKGKEVLIIE